MILMEILGGVLGLGKGWLESRQKRAEIKLETESKVLVARAEAEVKRLEKIQDAEIAWDNNVASQMDHTWKDEWFTILLSIPVLLAFVGQWGRDRATEGFAALATMPDWYMTAFLSAIAASFGIRALVNRFGFGKR